MKLWTECYLLVLGPTLFLLFDVCEIFGDLNVMCKLYADDLKLYTL